MLLESERKAVVEYGKRMISNRLVQGTGGNISLADGERQLAAVTPSGLDYFETRPEDVVVVDFNGKRVDGELRPSSELYFHLALYNLRPNIRAVVHTHSIFATTIACLGWELPAIHYLIAQAGTSVPCAPFATPGSHDLASHMCQAIGSGNAVLMANHGLTAVGPTLPKAFATAEKVEYVAQLYYQALSIGKPEILTETQMAEVMEHGKSYGQQQIVK